MTGEKLDWIFVCRSQPGETSADDPLLYIDFGVTDWAIHFHPTGWVSIPLIWLDKLEPRFASLYIKPVLQNELGIDVITPITWHRNPEEGLALGGFDYRINNDAPI